MTELEHDRGAYHTLPMSGARYGCGCIYRTDAPDSLCDRHIHKHGGESHMTDARRDVAERLEQDAEPCYIDHRPCAETDLPQYKWCRECVKRAAAALLRSEGREPDALCICGHPRSEHDTPMCLHGTVDSITCDCMEFRGTPSDSPAEQP